MSPEFTAALFATPPAELAETLHYAGAREVAEATILLTAVLNRRLGQCEALLTTTVTEGVPNRVPSGFIILCKHLVKVSPVGSPERMRLRLAVERNAAHNVAAQQDREQRG
jgi:hypothetical protein